MIGPVDWKKIALHARRHCASLAMEIWAHPNLYASFKEQFAEARAGGFLDLVAGVPIVFSELVPEYGRVWEFPDDPFVEYGPEDEAWARPLAYGREVLDTSNPVVFLVERPTRDGREMLPPLFIYDHEIDEDGRLHYGLDRIADRVRDWVDQIPMMAKVGGF